MITKTSKDNDKDSRKRVAIIGGGICGLTCGYLLSQKGYKVTIFERKKSLGGLLETKKYQNILYETFYHHIFINDFELLELIDQLELSSKIIWAKSNSANFSNGAFFPLNSIFDWFRFPGISLIDKIKGGSSTFNISLKKAEKYHHLTAYKFIGSFFGLSFLNKFWQPLFEKKFGSRANNISASWFISRLQKRAKGRKNNKEILGYMKGSFQLLINNLEEKILQSGAEIKCETKIDNIGKNKKHYIVNNEKFDFIISTVANPAIIFKNILPKKDLVAQSRISNCGIICANIISKKKLSEFYWVNILDKEIPFVSFVEQSNLFDYEKNDFHLIYLGWYLSHKEQDKFDKNAITNIVRKTIKKMFPNIKEKLIIDISVEKYAQPIIPAKIKLPLNTTSDKNIFITNMDHIFPHDRGLNEAVIEAKKISKLLP